MKRTLLLLAALAGCSTDPISSPPSQGGLSVSVNRQSADRTVYIVQLERTANPEAVARTAGAQPLHIYRAAINGFAAPMSEQAAEALWNNPQVISVERSGVARVVETQPNPPSWGLDRSDQRTLPLDQSYTAPQSGAGVHVYIIDTGLFTRHQEFGGRASFLASFIPEDGWTLEDCYGHGTHVSGTVAGATTGIAKAALLYNVRVLDCGGSGTWEGVIAGMDLVAASRQLPCVVNMSLGGSYVQAVNDAAQGLVNAGCVVVVASGNSFADACLSSPASSPNALTVNASDINDQRAWFSNYGACTDLYAPGVSIYSAAPTEIVGQPSCPTCYASWSGTSMATPHVAGAAAMLLSAQPSLTPAQVGAAIVADATQGVVVSNPAGTPNLLLFVGSGAQPPPPPPPPPADNASFAGSCSGFLCTFTAVSDGGWQVSDGSSGNGLTFTHSFNPRRKYVVTHTVGAASQSRSVNCNPKKCMVQ
jgi:subtilisin family serine protease